MNEEQAKALASIVGGEAWNSGGGIWLVTVHREDGSLIVFSGDAICEYEDEEAFDECRALNTIVLAVPDLGHLYVLVDLDGDVFFENEALRLGWRYEEEARREARALESRGEGRYQVVQQSELPA